MDRGLRLFGGLLAVVLRWWWSVAGHGSYRSGWYVGGGSGRSSWIHLMQPELCEILLVLCDKICQDYRRLM